MNRNCRIGLIVNEFFDQRLRLNPLLGGYGMLARHFIAEHIPGDGFEVDTIIGFNDGADLDVTVVDSKKSVLLLPVPRSISRRGLLSRVARRMARQSNDRQLRQILSAYDVFLCIETMPHTPRIMELCPHRKLVLYIQDPRPQYEWDELDTVIGTDDGSPRPYQPTQDFYGSLIRQDRLRAISQGEELCKKAQDLYDLPQRFPIKVVRNPMPAIPFFDADIYPKENAVLYLGRLDPVKRPWLALEIAKQMPDVTFYFLGKIQNDVVPYIIRPYLDLPNVKLLGHQDGDAKSDLLKRCKLLLNTSIHEAIPVSFLEALAYGTLLVSCQNPDRLTERFGAFPGKTLGDGRDDTAAFVKCIRHLLDDEASRRLRSQQAQRYVQDHHNLSNWIRTVRETCKDAASSVI